MGTLPLGPAGEPPDTARHRALAAASRVRMLRLVRQAEAGLTAAEVAGATGLHPSTVRAHLDRLVGSGLLDRRRRPDGSPGRPAWVYQAAGPGDDRSAAAPGEPADRPYRDLAAALVTHLARDTDDPHAAGVRAGRDWGRTLAAGVGGDLRGRAGDPRAPRARDARARAGGALDGLVRVLDRLGFSPRVVERDPPAGAAGAHAPGEAASTPSGGASPGTGRAVIHLESCPFLDLAQDSPDVVCGVHLGVIGGALGAFGASPADTELEPFALPGACVIRVRPAGAGGPVGR